MKQIKLTKGQFALVDDEDFERINANKWCVSIHHSGYYAHRFSKTSKKIVYMHREILNAGAGSTTDHINGNTLDNRRANLRLCTNSQNLGNRGKPSNNKSGYKGVSWHTKERKWKAFICSNRKTKGLGSYTNKEDAARAYDKAAKEMFGEFARTNFDADTPG